MPTLNCASTGPAGENPVAAAEGGWVSRSISIMAEEKYESRDVTAPNWMPWTLLFRGFQVAMDPKKLFLAAAGIVAMAAGWWVLAFIFYNAQSEPNWKSGKYKPESD